MMRSLFTPLSLCILLALLSLVALLAASRAANAGSRAARRVRVLGAAGALLAPLVLYWCSIGAGAGMVIRQWEERQPRHCSADAPTVVVFLASLSPPATDSEQVERLTPASYRRVVEALAVARATRATRLVLVGGGPSESIPESRVAASLAGALGWPRATLLTEETSLNTRENAERVAALLAADGGPILLVTSALHMPRALGELQRVGINASGCAVDFTPLPWWKGSAAYVPQVRILQKTHELWHEWIGGIWYRWSAD